MGIPSDCKHQSAPKKHGELSRAHPSPLPSAPLPPRAHTHTQHAAPPPHLPPWSKQSASHGACGGRETCENGPMYIVAVP